MANPLVDLQKLVSGTVAQTYLGTVVSSTQGKTTVRLAGGNTVEVWGTATANTEVLIKGGSIVAVVNKEDIPEIFIP